MKQPELVAKISSASISVKTLMRSYSTSPQYGPEIGKSNVKIVVFLPTASRYGII